MIDLLTTQFPSALLIPNTLLSTVLKQHNPFSSLNMTETKLHNHAEKGKICIPKLGIYK
jgi:hypothetical protein